MARQFLKILILLSPLLFFERCAQVVPLTGGKKDTTAPKLTEALPANASVNFNSPLIILKFNEYVQLKDLRNQLIVSPGLKTDPDISADGKKIKIELKPGELLPNTTYRFYFGKAIADMTEANPVNDFEYVFSTGPYIDSLKLSGKITEAFTNKDAADMVVGLYSTTEANDSLPFKKIPDYVSRSNGEGEFKFDYLPPRSFKVIAFSDKNKNYLYDGEAEKIAFREEMLTLPKDSSFTLSLSAFKEESPKLFIRKTLQPTYGKIQVIYNKKAVFKVAAPSKETMNAVFIPDQPLEKDTLTMYYHTISDSLQLFIRNSFNTNTDTLNLTLPKARISKLKNPMFASNVQSGVLPLNARPELTFYNPIDTSRSNLKKLQLKSKRDSIVESVPLNVAFASPLKLVIYNTLKEDVNYKVKIDSAIFYDYHKRYNDSTELSFKLQSKTEFGKVTAKLLFDKKQAYIVQLINAREEVVKEDFISIGLMASNAVTVDFTGVPPGAYFLKVIYDDDGNKKWDTGNYLKNKQPEKVFIGSKQIKAMADWDVEEQFQVK